MELKLINDKGESISNLAASDDLFGREFNEALIHQVVTARDFAEHLADSVFGLIDGESCGHGRFSFQCSVFSVQQEC